MLDKKSDRTSMEKQIWRSRVWLMLALLCAVAMWFGMSMYLKQEIIIVLLLLGVSTVTILGLAVAFILFQEGIRRAALWSKVFLVRIASLNRPMRPRFRRFP